MSGGRYDYLYGRVRDFADEVRYKAEKDQAENGQHGPPQEIYSRAEKRYLSKEESAPLTAATLDERLAFADHLRLVSEAMHDIEWVDSGDCFPGDEVLAIRATKEHLLLKERNDIVAWLEQEYKQGPWQGESLLAILADAIRRDVHHGNG